MNDLQGKHAVVTGGGSGVGASIALTLARAGATVTVCGRRADALENTVKRSKANDAAIIDAVTADVTDATSVACVFEQVRQTHGRVDIVVANAGAAESGRLERTESAQWARMIDVNLTGTFNTFKAALGAMRGQPAAHTPPHNQLADTLPANDTWGRLIAVASTAGLKGYAYVAPYCAAKHGVVGLVRALGVETAGTGITVNAVCPGFTETPMLDASIANIAVQTDRTEQQARDTLARTNPMRRFVQPEEVSAAVLWLCGTGSDAVTGQAIPVCAGETA